MSDRNDNTASQNATKELSPEEARKKRRELLELAKKQADEEVRPSDKDDPDDSIATFVLPGD